MSEGGKNKLVQNSAQAPDERKTRSELAKIAGVSHDTVAKVELINAELEARLECEDVTPGKRTLPQNSAEAFFAPAAT